MFKTTFPLRIKRCVSVMVMAEMWNTAVVLEIACKATAESLLCSVVSQRNEQVSRMYCMTRRALNAYGSARSPHSSGGKGFTSASWSRIIKEPLRSGC